MTAERGKRKTRVGEVVSDAMDKTVVVEIETRGRHSLYAKSVRKEKRLYAHDPENGCKTGDVVLVVETRPMSKRKRWRVAEVVQKARE